MASDVIMKNMLKKCGGFLEKLKRESPISYATFLRDMASIDPFKAGKQASLDHLRDVVFKSQPNLHKQFQQYLHQPETTSTDHILHNDDDDDDDDYAKLPAYLRVRKKSNYSLMSNNIPRDHILNHGFYELLPPTDMNFTTGKRSSNEVDKYNEIEKLYEEDKLPVRLMWIEEKLVKAGSGPKAAQDLTSEQLELIQDQVKEKRLTRDTIRNLTPHGLTHLALRLRHKWKESNLSLLNRCIQSRLRWRNTHPLGAIEKEDRILDDLRSAMETMKLELKLLYDKILITRRRNSSNVYNLAQTPHPKRQHT